MFFLICFLIFLLNISILLFKNIYRSRSLTKITYCSENFIIINKQADFKINSNRTEELTVQTFLKKKFPGLANDKLFHEFYFPHRLDYATSGILCIPKNKNVCKVVSEAFCNRSTKKYYIALVWGILSKNLVDINVPVGEDNRATEIQKMCTTYESAFCNNPRIARTIVMVLEKGLYNSYLATKILCRPITGRRHQIRAHCSQLGHTIVGDYTYSNRKDVKPPRMYLHSLRLVLPNCVENIDVSTRDPFTHIPSWEKVETIQNTVMAYQKLDNYVNSLDSS